MYCVTAFWLGVVATKLPYHLAGPHIHNSVLQQDNDVDLHGPWWPLHVAATSTSKYVVFSWAHQSLRRQARSRMPCRSNVRRSTNQSWRHPINQAFGNLESPRPAFMCYEYSGDATPNFCHKARSFTVRSSAVHSASCIQTTLPIQPFWSAKSGSSLFSSPGCSSPPLESLI